VLIVSCLGRVFEICHKIAADAKDKMAARAKSYDMSYDDSVFLKDATADNLPDTTQTE